MERIFIQVGGVFTRKLNIFVANFLKTDNDLQAVQARDLVRFTVRRRVLKHADTKFWNQFQPHTVHSHHNGPGYEQNLAVYNCEFLEMLRH
jgi:hypothetical protein